MTCGPKEIGSDGLTRRDRDLIRDVLARYPEVRRATLFGSRAMGTFGRGSDIDLALEGPDLGRRTLARIAADLEDSDLPYKVDLLLRDDPLEPKLEAHIRQHGKPFGWEEIPFADFCDITRGGSPRPIHDYIAPIGIPWVKIADVSRSGTRYINETREFIRPEGESKSRRVFPGDLILSNSATPGIPMFMGIEACIHDGWMLLRNLRGVDKLFCFYLLQHERANLLQQGNGSVFMNLKTDILKTHRVVIPPLTEQRAIAGVLGALDDKIEHNRRTARALERLARAIFRAWFVDFEPVKAKAEGRTAFPGMPQSVFDALPARFADSEIGPVPEEWEVKALPAVAALTMGQSPPSEFYNEIDDGLPFHQGVTDFRFRFPAHRVYCTTKGRLAEAGDILLSVRAPVGRINVADRQIVLGRGLAGLRHLSNQQSYLLYLLRHVFAEEDAIGDGTIYKAVTKAFLQGMELPVPPMEIRAAFENIAKPMDALILRTEKETLALAAMRDYLLPKLLSGSVRVEAACG